MSVGSCPHCRSYQPTFICPECYYFNSQTLGYYRATLEDITLPERGSALPENGECYQGNRQLNKILKDNPQHRVFQTFKNVDYKQFDALGNLKSILSGGFDVVVLSNDSFKIPVHLFQVLRCKYLLLHSFACDSYQTIANVLTFQDSIENVVLDFASSNMGVLYVNYQLLVQSVCGREQLPGDRPTSLPAEFLIYYQNRPQPQPKANILTQMTLQQMLNFANCNFQHLKLVFAALIPASHYLTQLQQIKIGICRNVSVHGFIGVKICTTQLDLPMIYPFLLHLNHLILGLPALQSVELHTQKGYYFLPVVNYEIYDELVKLKLIQRQKAFQLEPRLDYVLTDKPSDAIDQNQNVFLELFQQKHTRLDSSQENYISVLQAYNYDYYTMDEQPLQTVDVYKVQSLVEQQCGVFAKIMPPRTVLSLIRRGYRNIWYFILTFSSKGFCKGVEQYFAQEDAELGGLVDYLTEKNQLPASITYVVLFDYHKKEQLGANSTFAVAQLKAEVLSAAFYPSYHDLQMIKFDGRHSLVLQGFPEYAQLYTDNMQTEIDFLLACIQPLNVITDCPLICYFKGLMDGKGQSRLPLGLSDELFLPMLCQFHYIHPKCEPEHLDLHVEYRVRFRQASFQLHFSKQKTTAAFVVRNRSFSDESTAYDISSRVQLFFDMFPSIRSMRIINASQLLNKPQDAANLIVQLALRCDVFEFTGDEVKPLVDEILQGCMHVSGKYVKKQLLFLARLHACVSAEPQLHECRLRQAHALLRFAASDTLRVERIGDAHLFHGALNAPQFQDLLQALDSVFMASKTRALDLPNAAFSTQHADTAIANLVSLVHLLIARGVRVLRGSYFGNPRAAFLTTLMQCCLGERKCVQNIGFVDYKASFQLFRCEIDKLAENVTALVFQQFYYADQLCDFEDEIVELCTRLPRLERLLFIENGLSDEKQDAFERMLERVVEGNKSVAKILVVEQYFDHKRLRARFPQIKFSFAGDLIVRNGVVLKHHDGVADMFDILEIEEEVRLIDNVG